MQAIRSILFAIFTVLLLSPITSGCKTKSAIQTADTTAQKMATMLSLKWMI